MTCHVARRIGEWERRLRRDRAAVSGALATMEKTGDGRLRHPVFLGLREDKSPTEVLWMTAHGR